MHLYTLRPVPGCAKQPETLLKLQAGDIVTWRNPATKIDYPGLEVLYVHRSTGAALLRGWFGDYVRGRPSIRQQNAPIVTLTLQKRGGEQ